MQLQSSVTLSSEKERTFEAIYKVLMQGPEERTRFFTDIAGVIGEKGMRIDSKTVELLEGISKLHIDSPRMDFDQKLVLCSSSGY